MNFTVVCGNIALIVIAYAKEQNHTEADPKKSAWEMRKTMSTFKHGLTIRIVKISDVVLVTIPFALCWYLYYAQRIYTPFYENGNYGVIALFFVLYITFGRVYDAFQLSMQRASELMYSQMLAICASDVILYVVTWLLTRHMPNCLPMLAAAAAQVVLTAAWSFLANRWYFNVFPPQPTAVIYDTRQGVENLIGQYNLDKKYQVLFTAGVSECIQDLSMLNGLETVFLSGIHSHDRNVILKYCVEHGINVLVIPRLGDTIMSGAYAIHMFHLPMLKVGRYNPPPEYLMKKRLIDIVVSAMALVVLSPVFLVTAIAIKATDHGPVFYKQIRLTKDGKEFAILKFRSMRVDAEKDGVARLSSGENDSRITPVGKVIRACRVDELPQLINILRGELSIVGPRPERPEIAAQYCEEMPEFSLRLQAKAGLTGYAQVYGKYNTTPYDKLSMDLMYIAHPSLIEDIKIMLATVKILFVPESTEGVAEGQTTAMRQESNDKTVV